MIREYLGKKMNRGSYMSAHVYVNKMRGERQFYLFFATSLINPIIQEHECTILLII